MIAFTGICFGQPLPEAEREIIAVEKTDKALPTPEVAPQSFESSIVSAFKTGSASKLATFFGDNVDLSILDKENLYSKTQAEQVLKSFFTAHKPINFSILHKGKSGQSQYYIGELNSDKTYRVTLNSKPAGTTTVITSLTIEED